MKQRRRGEHDLVPRRQLGRGSVAVAQHQLQGMSGGHGGGGRVRGGDDHNHQHHRLFSTVLMSLTMQRLLLLPISSIRSLLLPFLHYWWRAVVLALTTTGAATRSLASSAGGFLNKVLSFVVFTLLDLVDAFLCVAYRLADYTLESEWRPCYCGTSGGAKGMVTSSGNILVSEDGGSKVVCLSSSNRLHLDDISDTLYWRPSILSEVGASTVKELRRIKSAKPMRSSSNCCPSAAAGPGGFRSASMPAATSSGPSTTFRVNSTIVEMLQGKMGRQKYSHPITPRWSDCDCKTCTSWIDSSPDSLFVHVEEPIGAGNPNSGVENVLFIHGFISSSLFWTETVFPSLSDSAKSKYRLFAVDLLGFGRSPRPADSLYTLREHVDMIEKSVLESYGVRSFHIVAHSLGSILALALAVKYPDTVQSITMIAPPYFPVPKGLDAATAGGGVAQYMLRKVAPRRVWPPIAFGASVACWYEHISRTVCLVICKHHRVWESAFRRITFNRVRTFLMEGFFSHSHNAAWHTVHNIICGSAGKVDSYLEAVSRRMACDVTVFHGRGDEVLPVECSLAVGARVPRANVRVLEGVDHITIVVGRQEAFARELEQIWEKSSSTWASSAPPVAAVSLQSKRP